MKIVLMGRFVDCGGGVRKQVERMHRCKADEDDEHNGNIGS